MSALTLKGATLPEILLNLETCTRWGARFVAPSEEATFYPYQDVLRRAQQAQGYGLRGDIVQAEQMMQINLSRAQSALQSGNVDQAKEYLDKAETQAMTLERFLGR